MGTGARVLIFVVIRLRVQLAFNVVIFTNVTSGVVAILDLVIGARRINTSFLNKSVSLNHALGRGVTYGRECAPDGCCLGPSHDRLQLNLIAFNASSPASVNAATYLDS